MSGLARGHDLAGEVFGAAGGVVAAEAVGENVGEAELLLGDEAAVVALVFQDQTATGKLKAEMMPTTPSGCHCSNMRCWGRSECMLRP